MTDDLWRTPAEKSRQALRLLGYDGPDCLPHEPDACSGTYLQHTVAHLAAIKACADHHLAHAGMRYRAMEAAIYSSVLADIEKGCDQEHRDR